MQFATIAPTRPHIRSGKLRALGVSGLQRVGALPDVPTLDEAGLPGFDATLWLGIFAPAKTPASLVSRINKEIATAVASAEVKDALQAQGVEATSNTPDQFAAYVKSELEKWKKAGEAAGIKPE
jgi:tripartite-type tricarboxylate transporter receptor subunit TctC